MDSKSSAMAYGMIDEILHERGLKRTKLRIALLNYLMDIKHAQSYPEIKRALGASVDKSTLYRNLTAFEEAGIIHRIEHSGFAKYAFGKAHEHGQSHAHFVCEHCETVYCLDELAPLHFEVPKGFKTLSVQTIIRGVCANC